MADGLMKRCAKAGESPLSFCLSVEIVAIQKDLSKHNVLLAQRSDLAEYWSPCQLVDEYRQRIVRNFAVDDDNVGNKTHTTKHGRWVDEDAKAGESPS
ncbi:unnamed protein product [Clavelina lepadiformis]|uniref:Uncharacterized protein n=1 Tax=Clavelina lepadiformis TaxID=159417 RepID=A0ABP0FUZ5_CLALP